MSLPRLSGEHVTLVPVPHAVAVAVLAGDPTAALAAIGLTRGRGWPHDDTADAVLALALAEQGSPNDESEWLVVVDGEVVGECGWRGGPDAHGDAELGYGLAHPYRGRGLGGETVGVLVAWALQQPGLRRLIARVLPGNEPSWRLLLRLGFTLDALEPPYQRYALAQDRQH